MIYELEVKNIPQSMIDKSFEEFLFKEAKVDKAAIVHYQQQNNKKILLFRLRNEQKFHSLQTTQLEYKGVNIELSPYKRELVTKINSLLKEREEPLSGILPDEEFEDKISTIYLSNIPKYLKDFELKKKMGEFGTVKKAGLVNSIHGSNVKKPQNGLRCRFAFVQFSSYEEAVNAFFTDKVRIRNKNLKIKLYIPKRNFTPGMKMNQNLLQKKRGNVDSEESIESKNFKPQLSDSTKSHLKGLTFKNVVHRSNPRLDGLYGSIGPVSVLKNNFLNKQKFGNFLGGRRYQNTACISKKRERKVKMIRLNEKIKIPVFLEESEEENIRINVPMNDN